MTELRHYLMSVLRYESDTGLFYWRESRGRVSKDTQAGALTSTGYIRINVDRVTYRAHRLAWLFQYGKWPKDQIDHINKIKTDNRIVNLRQATMQQNQANAKIKSNNKIGFKGVAWLYKSKKWMARITVDQQTIYLGSFLTKEEAHAAYIKAAKNIFGEYASGG